jgi:hypothetical protein
MCNLCHLLNIFRRGWENNSNVDIREKNSRDCGVVLYG